MKSFATALLRTFFLGWRSLHQMIDTQYAEQAEQAWYYTTNTWNL
jgi:hypothetical protein